MRSAPASSRKPASCSPVSSRPTNKPWRTTNDSPTAARKWPSTYTETRPSRRVGLRAVTMAMGRPAMSRLAGRARRLGRLGFGLGQRGRGRGLALGVGVGAGRGGLRQARSIADLALDVVGHLGVLAQELAGRGAALTEALVVVAEEGAALVHDVGGDAEVEQRAFARDAGAVHDVELGRLEGRRDLVLGDLDAHPVADRFGALFERLDAADVEADGGVELERLAAGGRFGVAEHDADLLAELVGEHADRARLA